MRLDATAAVIGLAACGFDGAGARIDGPTPATAADAPIDGLGSTPADAAPCPGTYDANGHRLHAMLGTWLAAEAACEADAPGQSHLVVLDDDGERASIAGLIQALPGDAWVGIVRDPGDPWVWRVVTAMRRSSGFLYDYGVDQASLYAVCECDGRPPIDADYSP